MKIWFIPLLNTEVNHRFAGHNLSILAAAVLVIGCWGCTKHNNRLWIDPDEILLLTSEKKIESHFQKLFSSRTNGHELYKTEKVSTAKSDFLFVTAYPYRGRAHFGIYCFEQVSPNEWHLRAVLPIVEAQIGKAKFISKESSVVVLIDDKPLHAIESVKNQAKENQRPSSTK